MFEIRDKLKNIDCVLASQSPRRKELLSTICDKFRVIPAVKEEKADMGIETAQVPVQLALNKCREVAEQNPDSLVIGCDTVVLLNDIIMGKPKDIQDAFRMLSMLSGNTHKVVSGTAIYYKGKYVSFASITEVDFKMIDEWDIRAYIATGEPFDKAGAYGIQGKGSLLIKAIRGDYFNVVGLPVSELADKLSDILSVEELL